MRMLATLVSIAALARAEAGPAGGTIKGHVVGISNGKALKPQPSLWVYAADTRPHHRDAGKKQFENKEIRQRGIKFDPNVIMVPTGTVIDFSNREDREPHNVFSPDPIFFDLDRYQPKASKPHKFDAPGEVSIYCDIHQCMWARIFVVDVPASNYIAQVDKDGNYTLSGLPDGTYEVRAWTSNSTPMPSDPVTVTSGETATAAEIHLQVGPSPGSQTHQRKDSTAYPQYASRCPK